LSSLPYPNRFRTVDALVPNPLLLPGKKHLTQPFTILGGQRLLAGSVVGVVTASGKVVLSLSAAGDGSQVPIGILAEDVNSYAFDGVTALDVGAPVYVEGVFNATALTLGTGQTVAGITAAFAARAIYLQNPGFSG